MVIPRPRRRQAKNRKGTGGLRSLRERAEHAGGTVTATPTPTGFQLTTILPLREA